MSTHIALLRGINVGGRNLLPMKDLKALFEAQGCQDVRTYIQSGNVVFRRGTSDPARLARRVTNAVSSERGFAPHVLVLTQRELGRAAADNPFPEADANPTGLHLFFLSARPSKPDLGSLDALRTPTERFVLKGKVFYLHAPDGIGASRLAARAERCLGVDATARNWRTVKTLIEMAGR